MCAKEFGNRFPLSKLNRKEDFKRAFLQGKQMPQRPIGRHNLGATRRGQGK